MKLSLNSIPSSVMGVARRIEQAGGEATLVGGGVIAILRDELPKDHDIEVFNLPWSRLVELFPEGKMVGASFGILTINVDGFDVDLNIPRIDNRVGLGHSDFEVAQDPFMSKHAAGERRDFTINTMAISLRTGQLFDSWGGRKDLDAGVLRATSPELFVQDPLRVLRAMQLLARKAKRVDPATMALVRTMVPELRHLPPERLREEFKKLATKAAVPSVGMEFLVDSGAIHEFPVLEALRGTEQSPEWHPEGDVWTHSLLAMDAAAEMRHNLPEEDREVVVMAALLHDVGKPSTTVTPEMVANDEAPRELLWTARGHDRKGMGPADEFLKQLTGPEGHKAFRKKVVRLVGEHMQPHNLLVGEAKEGAWARLHRRLQQDGSSLEMLGRVCQCDACATSVDWRTRSLASGEPNWEHATSERVFDWAEEFNKVPPEPKVMGRHLIAHGIAPGEQFGKILEKCLELQDANPSWGVDALIDEALPQIEGAIQLVSENQL